MKVIALIDGEHVPAVTRWGLASARAEGYEVVAAVFVGGSEKASPEEGLDVGPDLPVAWGTDPRRALTETIDGFGAEGVLDLADEPALTYERRMELVAVALSKGITYVGPDFRFEPPILEAPLPVPTVGVIGTGKRVGKTAVAGHVARLAKADGLRPVVVAMGRGGPPAPVVAGPGDVTLEALLGRVDRGEHAASDYLEDALTSGVPTVGARRCGGGLAGRPFVTNVAEAAAIAVGLDPGLVILEGSGASIPTVPWDAGVLVAPAALPTEHLAGYLGPFRLLLSDLVVLIIGSGSFAGPENLSTLDSQARRLRADVRVAIAELQPVPLADVRGKDAFFATTANHERANWLTRRLEETAGCRVIGTSWRLADRAGLRDDLTAAPEYDVLLTELKAAAVDVAARSALRRGAEVVFVDNRPVSAGGDGDLDDLVRDVMRLSSERAGERLAEHGSAEG
jgi:cyclic 2,3-diphosphoglycerate synthetase